MITFLDTSMLVVATCSWINLYRASLGQISVTFSYYIAMVTLILYLIYAAYISAYLLWNKTHLESLSQRGLQVKKRAGAAF